jgi:hypothetical protein
MYLFIIGGENDKIKWTSKNATRKKKLSIVPICKSGCLIYNFRTDFVFLICNKVKFI